MALGNVNLTPQLIQAVRDTVDVAEIAARHTSLEKRGDRLWGLCPFHKEKTPSFSVEPVQGLYYCFGCGAGGDAIRLHMMATGDEFPEAIEALAQEYGIPLPSSTSGGRGAQRERDLEQVLAQAEKFFVERLGASPGARAYLEERRIPGELIERFGLGYAPDDFQALVGALRESAGLEALEAAGLVGRSAKSDRPYDRFRHRLMFPIRNPSGRLVGFGGRTLGDDRAKYINTRETERFQKRYLIYGLDVSRRAVREKGAILLVEGYFDLLAAVASGVEWVGATMGTALSAEQVRLCSRYADRVVMCYDGDAAGREAQRRALPLLLRQGIEVSRVELPSGADPDTVRLESGPETFRACVDQAVDSVAAELESILPAPGELEPATQARSAKAVRELLGTIPDPVLRFGYGRRAADRLGIPQDVLWKSPGVLSQAREVDEKKGSVRIVTSLEERILQLLLRDDVDTPALEDLPPQDVFLDPICGNIYAGLRAVYKQDGGPPTAKAVLAGLSHEGETLDRAARILLEESSCSEADELRECLQQLNKRWRQHRLKVLAQQIKEAQRAGEVLRLDELVEEKTSLTRLLHDLDREPTGSGS